MPYVSNLSKGVLKMVKLEEILERDITSWNPFMNKRLTFGEYWLSVQCSTFHYCRPRTNTSLSNYTHFEVMMNVPKELITDEWEHYSDGTGVYGFVPKELIEELCSKLMKYIQ